VGARTAARKRDVQRRISLKPTAQIPTVVGTGETARIAIVYASVCCAGGEGARELNFLNVLAIAAGALMVAAVALGGGLFITPGHFWFGFIGTIIIVAGPGALLFFFPYSGESRNASDR
jgi:hypothetical protein